MTVRADLKAAIEAAVQPTYPQVQVYASPEDVTQLPAIVLVPGSPWCEPSTMGGGPAGALHWQFVVSLCAHRAAVESSIDLMENLRPLVEKGILTLGGRWSELRTPDTIDLAGAQALVAPMDIHLLTERQT